MPKKTAKSALASMESIKNTSLRERVYQYLSTCITNGELQYNEYFDQNAICKRLNVSRAPLRDALIRLEAESFVTIHPNRGVLVKPLDLKYIQSAYQICGQLEAACLEEVFSLFTPEHIALFEASNIRQRLYLEAKHDRAYYDENIYFHDIFLSLSANILLRDILVAIRRRLYDFPQKVYLPEWESVNIEEHDRFIISIKKGNKLGAISILRDEHWSYEVHKQYFNEYYAFLEKNSG